MTKLIFLMLAFLRPAAMDFASMGSGWTGGPLDMYNAMNQPAYEGWSPGDLSTYGGGWQQSLEAMHAAISRNAGLVDPAILKSYSQLMGIDLSGILPAGQQAGQQYGNLAGQAQQQSGVLNQAGMDSIGRGQQIWQNTQDPMGQQFEQQRQQTLEGVRGAESARGVSMGDYGAGLEGDQLRSLGIDWKNFQDQRQINANQAVNAANFGAQQDFSQGMNTGAQVPGYMMASAQAPISAQQTVAGAPMDYANMFTQAEQNNVINPYGWLNSQYGNYLGMANQAGLGKSNFMFNEANSRNQMEQQAQYGIWGGGQSGTNYMQGNQSGMGNPMNYFGMGGGGGGMGG